MKKILYVGFTFFLVLVVGMLVFYENQTVLIFGPTKTSDSFTYPYKNAVEKELIFDSERIHTLLFRRDQPKGLILYFHGNADSLDSWAAIGEELSEKTHRDVWMLDYPGFGKSRGSIESQDQLIKIGQRFIEMAKVEFPGTPLILFGRSMGAAIAAQLAADFTPQCLILETPFLSLEKMAEVRFPFLPRFLVRFPFRSDLALPRVQSKVFIIHGTEDEIVPFDQGQALAATHRSHTTFVSIAGGHHGDLRHYPIYWSRLSEFLDSPEARSQN